MAASKINKGQCRSIRFDIIYIGMNDVVSVLFVVGRRGNCQQQDMEMIKPLMQMVMHCIDKTRRIRLTREVHTPHITCSMRSLKSCFYVVTLSAAVIIPKTPAFLPSLKWLVFSYMSCLLMWPKYFSLLTSFNTQYCLGSNLFFIGNKGWLVNKK